VPDRGCEAAIVNSLQLAAWIGGAGLACASLAGLAGLAAWMRNRGAAGDLRRRVAELCEAAPPPPPMLAALDVPGPAPAEKAAAVAAATAAGRTHLAA
jgi:hypothetical protein